MPINYYNEFDPKAAASLKQLIVDGLIPKGDVDVRSITEVTARELRGYTQCHFFAGIGGWSRALHLAGWPDDRPVWTGSCPCQPFSAAGKQKGGADDRDLWPVWFNLIRECRPASVYGEQVASAVSHGWLDRVHVDMEGADYACAAAVLPACAVDAPHRRDRLWFVAHAERAVSLSGSHPGIRGEEKSTGPWHGPVERCGEAMADPENNRFQKSAREDGEQERRGIIQSGLEPAGISCDVGHPESQRSRWGAHHENSGWGQCAPADSSEGNFWGDHNWILCADGKARHIPPAQSGIRLLAHGIPERVGLLRAAGNAIVPEVAARFIRATEGWRG